LNKLGLRENTLVIFSSDNGANIGEEGSSAPYRGGKGNGTQQEGWVRVPTIFSMPGVVPKGKDYHKQIANFDFYSTIASVTGLPIPKHCDGVNLIPFIIGKNKEEPHEYLFWLNNEPGDAERRHLIAVRWEKWRLYKKYDKDPWQLFDLEVDPKEEKNIAKNHADIVERLSAKHAAWRKTLAPLGKIPKLAKSDDRIGTGHGWSYAKR
jgi:arylsulfatase A-like enzyme